MVSRQAGAKGRGANGASPSAGSRAGLESRHAGADPGRSTQPQLPITPEQRLRIIAEAAYFRALQRGFASGGEVRDWLEAETEVDARLQSG